jgi:archaemetzincin
MKLGSLCLLIGITLGITMQFKPPTSTERLAAIGSTAGLPETLRRAFTPTEAFAPIPVPGPSDWLANHREDGQTYDDFLLSHPNRPDKSRNKLYLQPLGEFVAGESPSVEQLQQFASTFFMIEVKVLPALNVAEVAITTRRNRFTGKAQMLTGDILALLRKKLPTDAFAMLGITMTDLYPEESWNFVFGQASLTDRVGVYSFARYDPQFYGEARPNDWQALLLRRSCKVLAHETAHMFGIQHCIYYTCLMNGSNHLEESDARPMHLCPVDLRKLQQSVGFDPVERYSRLRDFCKQVDFTGEADWLTRRLEYIAGKRSGP